VSYRHGCCGDRHVQTDPEGLYGRQKITALVRRPTVPAEDGTRDGDLLNRDFTAPRPDHSWAMDFTYCRSWAGWVYVAFIVDVFSLRIIGWYAPTTKHVELAVVPLRMSLWERDRQGHLGPPDPSSAVAGAFGRRVAICFVGLHRKIRPVRHRSLN